MSEARLTIKKTSQKAEWLLLLVTLVILGGLIELGYRLLDPFPYFGPAEVNATEHGAFTQYDPQLGWKGTPDAREIFITPNSLTLIEHNAAGFRDIEHPASDRTQPAVVFLGDSFAWGYEVNFDEMAVNRLRAQWPAYSVYNLGHRGYGTDQALLSFRDWHEHDAIKLVVLLFYDNDPADNAAPLRYAKAKPRFKWTDGQLHLTNVPVPRQSAWDQPPAPSARAADARLDVLLAPSHALHDIYFRLRNLRRAFQTPAPAAAPRDMVLTGQLIRALRDDVQARGAQLVIAAIPSPAQLIGADPAPYQPELARICADLDIPLLDLQPALQNTLLRTYFRQGIHWNPRGHQVAATAIDAFLRERQLLP